MHLLFVCSGNTCRSPMAEGLARRIFAKFGIQADVSSRGTRAEHGVAELAVEAMARRNIDISDHLARQIEEKDISEADLILGMSEEHCSTVRSLIPEARNRTFTLQDFVTRAEDLSGRSDEQIANRVAQVAHTPQRDFSKVEDPLVVGTEEAYERTAQRIEEMLHRLAGVLVSAR